MCKREIFSVFLTLTLLSSIIIFSLPIVNAPELPTVSVEPQSQTIVGPSPFTINITVQNVNDLYTWQVVLYYNATILQTREDLIVLPPDHVFAGKNYVSPSPSFYSDAKGTYLMVGASLRRPETSGVNVAEGVLCQITFIPLANGTSPLTISEKTERGMPTFLWNSTSPKLLPINIVDGQVTVEGIGKPLQLSIITLEVPESVYVRKNMTVSGKIKGLVDVVNETVTTGNVGDWVSLNHSRIQPYSQKVINSTGYIFYKDYDYEIDYDAGRIRPKKNYAANQQLFINYTYDAFETVGANVTIYYKDYTLTPSVLDTVQTNSSGHYQYVWTADPPNPTTYGFYTYDFYASWSGDENYSGSSSGTKSVTVHKLGCVIAFNVTRDGLNIIINGSIILSPPIDAPYDYQNVTISYCPQGGEYNLLGSVKPDENGFFTYTNPWKTNATGTYTFKVEYPGDKYIVSRYATKPATFKKEEEEVGIMAYLPYIIVTIVVIVAAISIYFIKIRRRQRTASK